MKTIEYQTVDKSEWGDGPWQNEPDKKQWQDPETGLPCLIVRGPGGALCGYVGVPEGHPWHGKNYSNLALDWDDPERKKTPEAVIDAHGGLTFAGACFDVDLEDYETMLKNVEHHQKQAKQHPLGDSAEWLARWLPHLWTYSEYAAKAEAEYICHKPEKPEEAGVWWFGFDCAHAGDILPKHKVWRESLGLEPREIGGDVYRDFAYVTEQVTSLAKQLAAVK